MSILQFHSTGRNSSKAQASAFPFPLKRHILCAEELIVDRPVLSQHKEDEFQEVFGIERIPDSGRVREDVLDSDRGRVQEIDLIMPKN